MHLPICGCACAPFVQAVGFAERAEVAGDTEAATAVSNFFEMVTGPHAYATGGSNAKEFWFEPGHLGEAITMVRQGVNDDWYGLISYQWSNCWHLISFVIKFIQLVTIHQTPALTLPMQSFTNPLYIPLPTYRKTTPSRPRRSAPSTTP